ncbi:MAG TPA: mucoidy inhibitor MuiA family protein [Holophagaceae bacterium]|nr:mucoidy inhibitor MuiA family protein [Holophagaceae bacterium]
MRLPLLLPALTLALAAQAPLALKAPMTRVRLHPDEAWVTRTGRGRVEAAGVHRLELTDLPTGLRLEDLQVSAKGPAGTRMGDVAVRADVRTVTETAEWKKLEAEREGLRDRRDALEAQRDSLASEQKFLKELQATHAKELSTRLTYTLPSTQSVAEFGKGLQQRLATLMKEERRAARDLGELAKEEKRLDAELAKRQGEQRTAPSIVRVEVTTSGAGPVELELTYRQIQARWRPVYEARLSEDRKTLALGLYAAITQKTGESWEGVKLEISNARPSRGLGFETFDGPQVVEVMKPMPKDHAYGFASGGELSTARRLGAVAQLAPGVSQETRSNTFLIDGAGVTDAKEDNATMVDEASGLSATWALDGSKDIPSDGEPHRFRVVGKDLSPKLALLAVPRLEANVQQVARFEAPGNFPLFPSATVTHYVGAQRLGESPLSLPAPKQPFQLGFGPYKALRVSLRKLDHKEEVVGTFSKERQWTLRDLVELANDGGEALEVEVQDRVLKSNQEQVKVTFLPETTPGAEERIPGVRTWKVQVPAKGTGTVTLATQVRAPQDGEVSGLE